LDLPHLHLRVK